MRALTRYLSTIVRPRAGNAFAVAAALTFGMAQASYAQAPDLVPLNVVGPAKVHVDTEVVTHVTVANFGGPLVGLHTVEILLSTDPVVSVDDTLVASMTTDILGTFPMTASIPAGMTPGEYQWMMRILPAPGELATGNNELAGIAVLVIKTVISLDDPTPITVFAKVNDPVAPTPIVVVSNIGTLGDILVYYVEENETWLTPNPPINFSVAGEPGSEIALEIAHQGLPVGTYNTTVTFRNVQDADDYVDLSVTLEIGHPRFIPGDRLQGTVGSPGDVDTVVFDGLEGMKLRLKAKTSSGDLKPKIRVIDPDGVVEKIVCFPHTEDFIKKTVKLANSGLYTLEIFGGADTYGNYKIKTGRTLPKKALPRTVKVDASMGSVKVLMLKDAIFNMICKPNGMFEGPLDLTLRRPSGDPIPLPSLFVTAEGYVVVDGVPIDEAGAYRVEVAGFGSDSKERVKLTVAPVQPKKGASKVYLP